MKYSYRDMKAHEELNDWFYRVVRSKSNSLLTNNIRIIVALIALENKKQIE